MNKREIKYIVVATLVGILGFILLDQLFFSTEDVDEFPLPPAVSTVPLPKPKANAEAPAGAPEATTPTTPAAPGAHLSPRERQQEKLLHEFKLKIRLDFQVPRQLGYAELDLDDQVAVLFGREASGGKERDIALLAIAKIPTVPEIISFLNEHKALLPLMMNRSFGADAKVLSFPVSRQSGLTNLRVIPGPVVSDYKIYAALAERIDKRGAYLFMLRAPASYYEKNDGELDNMLASLRTLKP